MSIHLSIHHNSRPSVPSGHADCSKQALPRELDLARRLPLPEAALGDADAVPLGQLVLVLVGVPGAGAVVGEVDAGEGVGAEVLVAGSCIFTQQSLVSTWRFNSPCLSSSFLSFSFSFSLLFFFFLLYVKEQL